MPDAPNTERRALLGTAGLLAAAASLPGTAEAAQPAAARPETTGADWTLDTMKGLAVFVMPGPDAYSRRQGTPRAEPGGIEARLPAFLVDTLDRYLRIPGDAVVPLSSVVALLLNAGAVRVDPGSLAGPFLAPFPRLAYRRKAKVFELMEGSDADLVALLDAHLPEPFTRTASGLLRFLAGALLELSALGGYSEWGVFDPATRRLRGRPVGWAQSGYTSAAEGRPEFRGYYQDRKETTG